jgi:hypothetical protein
MKNLFLAAIVLGSLQCTSMQDSAIIQIEKSLGITIPGDLRAIWLTQPVKLEHRVFKYGVHENLYFLFPGDSIRQFNGSKKSIVEFSNVYNEKNKHIVFATSVFEEAFINVYYKFDSLGNAKGIYLSDGDQGYRDPMYLGETIDGVFPNILTCFTRFNSHALIERRFVNQHPNTIFPDTIAIFPKASLMGVLDTLVIKENYLIYLNLPSQRSDDTQERTIRYIYEKVGGEFEVDNPAQEDRGYEAEYLTGLINFYNTKQVNDKPEGRIFNICFRLPDNLFAVVLCTPSQARELNKYGLIAFNSAKLSAQEYAFMKF